MLGTIGLATLARDARIDARKKLLIAVLTATTVGCATLTSDAMTPVAFSFSDGSSGKCVLTNKRGVWSIEVPTNASIRRSDDALKYQCETRDGREATGAIQSTVGAKIVASAVFLDFGITDAITDKHREYPASFVIPVARETGTGENSLDSSTASDSTDQIEEFTDIYAKLEKLNDLRARGILTDLEFEAEKKKLLDGS